MNSSNNSSGTGFTRYRRLNEGRGAPLTYSLSTIWRMSSRDNKQQTPGEGQKKGGVKKYVSIVRDYYIQILHFISKRT
jgi:hypothetical protein